ncbi:MAG: dihydroorotase [Truepera sp.]|nr:dihydroorotase [Truepera sp.]
MSRVLIQNARLRPGDAALHDLYLRGGVVEGLDLGGAAAETFDAAGNLVVPAFIDLHAHLREPGQEVKEDLTSGLAAAAAAGYGTVVSMANTEPPIDEPGLVTELIARAERLGQARLRPAAALSRGLRGEQLSDFAALQEAGAVMVTDDGLPVADAHLMRRACEYAAELGLVVQTHSEAPDLRQDGVMNEGEVSQRLGLPGNPVAAEVIQIARDCEIARLSGGRVHIAHVSSRRGLEVVERAQAEGVPVTTEVTPHHLTLSDRVLEQFDPIHKVAPPLRTEADIAYLRSALRHGLIECIGTDHAPHTRAEKELDLLEAPFGIANIEVAFPLLYTRLVATDELELARLLELLTAGPAGVMGWPKPTLEPGAPADLTVIDLETERPVRPETFLSRAKFSPWAGEALRGWPVMTFVRGRRVFALADPAVRGRVGG